jgi:auxin efflux carrier family protein
MVVAASLVSPREEEPSEQCNNDEEETSQEETHVEETNIEETQVEEIHEESPIMSDPNFGPHHLRRRSSINHFQQSIRRGSARIVSTVPRSTPKMRRLLLWYTLSRLIVSPGIVVAVIVGLDYGGVLDNVPDLAKLVVIINAAVPGALIVAVLLQSKPELAEMAAMVAKVYLPSYLLSIVTIAAWTALGLWIALPDEKKR